MKYAKLVISTFAGFAMMYAVSSCENNSIKTKTSNFPQTTQEKVDYIKTFVTNYREINPQKNAPKSFRAKNLFLNQKELEQIRAISDEEFESRQKAGEDLAEMVSDGFAEHAYMRVYENGDLRLIYSPNLNVGREFQDIMPAGLELGTSASSRGGMLDEGMRTLSKTNGQETESFPTFRDTMYSFTRNKVEKFGGEEIRDLNSQDVGQIKKEYEQALDHVVRVLKDRYGNKFNSKNSS